MDWLQYFILKETMDIFEIRSYIETVENDPSPFEERNFERRAEVLDFLGFQVIDRIEGLRSGLAGSEGLISLKCRAEKLRLALEEIDGRVFQRLRSAMLRGGYRGTAFKELVAEYVELAFGDKDEQTEPGYDHLDEFINRFCFFGAMPEQTWELEPGMVYYQKTPARIVFELVEKCQFTREEVFFDVGAGLGQVAILVNLLAGIKVEGVEVEPAFCSYARNSAAGLGLSDLTFINVDARKADFSEGTVFFMYTPFKGGILQEVLEMLRKESLFRKIRIITYGPCNAQVALQDWLTVMGREDVAKGDGLCIFETAF
jgi:hypothetical protein